MRCARVLGAPFYPRISVQIPSTNLPMLTGSLTPHFIPRSTPRLSWKIRSAASPPSNPLSFHRFAPKIIPEGSGSRTIPLMSERDSERERRLRKGAREGVIGVSEGDFHVKSRTILYCQTALTPPPF